MKSRTSPLPLLLILTLWPVLLAVGGIFAFILLDAGEFREAWLPNWQYPLHLGLVGAAPAAALSVGIGHFIARSRAPFLVFIAAPLISIIATIGGIGLHYALLGSVHNPLLTGLSVSLAALALVVILGGARR